MAGVQRLFLVVVLGRFVFLTYGCPSECECSAGSTKVYCKGERISANFPATTSELTLSNSNLTTVPWDLFKSLGNLKYLNLDAISVDCNCKYYEYWSESIQTNKVNISGRCVKPLSVRGRRLDTAGSAITYCKKVPVYGAKPTSLSSSRQAVSTVVMVSPSVMDVAVNTKTSKSRSIQQTPLPSSTEHLTASSAVIEADKIPPTSSVTLTVSSTPVVAPLPPVRKASRSIKTLSPSNMGHVAATSSAAEATKIHPTSSVTLTVSSTPVVAPLPPVRKASLSMKTPSSSRMGHLTTTSSAPEADRIHPTLSVSLVASSTSAALPPVREASTTTLPTTDATTESATTTGEITTLPSTTPKSSTTKPTTPVPGAPHVTLSLLTPDVPIGSLAWVFCKVTGHPSPDIVMTLNGQRVDNMDGVTYSRKTNGVDLKFVANVDSEVSCSATNRLGRDKRVFRVPINQLSTGYILMRVKLIEETYSNKLEDKTSVEFTELQEKIYQAFAVVFNQFVGFYGASLVRVRPGSVIADILIKTANASEAAVKKVIEQEMVDAKLGSLSVDRYFYSFQTATACSGQYLNTTWADMVPGQYIIGKCPRGAQGFARRNCTAEGNWYYPDYTHCKSESFTDLWSQMMDATEGSNSDDQIKDVLQNLTRLTVRSEDYAEMAGDILTSVEIIETLVSHTKEKRGNIALSKDEAKVVVQIASNLLNKNNEQEFIVAQKVVQTASDLIRSLDEYALQSSLAVTDGGEDLTFFIEENVVMGAGVVYPNNITKDVTFPDYDIAAVDQVRKRWNASSFLVIDLATLKKMKDAKQIKLAGFMYKTLTRILSAESAYSNDGLGYEINSAVIAIALDPKPKERLSEPVTIASRNLDEVKLDGDDVPICAFWDFDMNPPNGGWSSDGCWYTHYNTENTTCLCDHMTNFAVLREKPLPDTGALTAKPLEPPFLLCILIGCIIMVCFCAITLFLLLIAAWRMKPDRTWGMHMFICTTLIVAFALIIVGLYSYNDVGFCNLLSMLVHYFYLCAFAWIVAESIYMHLWSTQNGPKKRHWIAYIFLGFVVPGIPMIVAWLMVGMSKFDSPWSCWMVLFPGYLLWVFFGPAILFTVIAMLVFRRVWKFATGPLRVPLKATYWRTRFRVHVRYSVAILLMLLITWLMGLLIITFFQKVAWVIGIVMCVLFILCCAVTGLIILVYYCIMDRQFDDGIRECCCLCCRGRHGKYWVKGEEYWAQEQQAEPPQEELMPPERDVHEIVLQPVDEPLIKLESRPPVETSLDSLNDPLYERVRRPGEEPPAEPEEEPAEPVYAKVHKPKREPEPEDEIDPFPIARPGSPRFLRGLTRDEVIRMAKKSDASKRHLCDYESPKGSRDDLSDHPRYMLNQQELDEELRHFRSFFAEQRKHQGDETPSTSTPLGTPQLPRTTSTSSSTSSTKTKKVMKKKKKISSTSSEGKAVTQEESTEEHEHSVFTFESHTTKDTRDRETSSPVVPPRQDSLPMEEGESEKSPPLPPRAANLLDDDDDDDEEEVGGDEGKDTEKYILLVKDDDDDSLTDVSADDLDRYDSDDDSRPLDGSRPTEV